MYLHPRSDTKTLECSCQCSWKNRLSDLKHDPKTCSNPRETKIFGLGIRAYLNLGSYLSKIFPIDGKLPRLSLRTTLGRKLV